MNLIPRRIPNILSMKLFFKDYVHYIYPT
jgi:hypothetical protein